MITNSPHETDKSFAQPQKLLWDLPVRCCHWLMVLLLLACWWTAEEREIVYHSYCAYALLGVVIFRIYWGFWGSNRARFKYFLTKPRVAWQYLAKLPQRRAQPYAGHNPVGGYSVVMLLLLLLVQIGLGLFSIDVDGFDGGPFSDYLSFKTSRLVTAWHATVFDVLLGFVVLHVAAVMYYLLWRKQNLTAAMLHGKAPVEQATETASWLSFITGVVIASIIVWFFILL